MSRRIACIALGSLVTLAVCAADDPEREMNVRQGPETVFEKPIAELFPILDGASANGANGRIGNELVFWGYELADGRNANVFACAMIDDVDCAARVSAICPGAGKVLEHTQIKGRVRSISCRAVSVETPGNLRPGCDDREVEQVLDTGLIQCE